jgi:choice-of-anchor A domain-containing protein
MIALSFVWGCIIGVVVVRVVKRSFIGCLLLIGFVVKVNAGIINLGSADKYTFAVGQYDFHGTPVGGTLQLGSEALIHGSVAASNHIGFGTGSVVYGNACSRSTSGVANVSGTASMCSDVVSSSSFDLLSQDIAAANEQARALAGSNYGALTASTLFDATTVDVLTVSNIDLASGEFLSVTGSAHDYLVINILGDAIIGSGAGILLMGDLSSENVLFNFANLGQSTFNFGGADISGTFLANNGAFIAGDGARLEDVRFYTNNAIIANVQTVRTVRPTISAQVPEPSTLVIFFLGFISLFAKLKYSNKSNSE